MSVIGRWIEQLFFDPRRSWVGFRSTPRFLWDFRRYRRAAAHERVRVKEMHPQLHDRTGSTQVDAHYFYANWWTLSKVAEGKPRLHLDIGSQAHFVGLMTTVTTVVFIDYRPLQIPLPALVSLGADATALPLGSHTVHSLSSIHVIEHVGLGRYGDPLDPWGTRRALREMARVLAPAGDLFIATPIGVRTVNFNAHRVHRASDIVGELRELALVDFSAVDDQGQFCSSPPLEAFDDAQYACGLFHFRRI